MSKAAHTSDGQPRPNMPPEPPTPRNFKKAWASALFNWPDKPTGAIAMAFRLYVDMNAAGEGMVISDADFMRSCNVSDGAVRNFKRWLVAKGFIAIQARGGRGGASTFKAMIPELQPAPHAGYIVLQPASNAGIEIAADTVQPAPHAGNDTLNRHGMPATNAGNGRDNRHQMPVKDPIQPAPDAGKPIQPAPDAGENSDIAHVLAGARDTAGARGLVYNNNKNPPSPPACPTPPRSAHAEEAPPAQPQADALEAPDAVIVNCKTIKGPNFVLDLVAVDQAAMLCGMPSERARIIAEMHAREWAANGTKPNQPMAYIKRMIANDKNQSAVDEVRLTKAATGPQRQSASPADATSRRARLAAWADEVDDKGSRK